LVQKLDFNNFYSYPLIGTKVYDILNNQHGTIAGPTFNSRLNSFPSGSLYFNGNGQYIDFGTSPTNFPTGDISASVWINFSQLNNASWNIFMTKWFGGTTDFHYSVKYNGTNYKQNLYTTNSYDNYGNSVINPNSWYNLGFTLTNGGALQLYINGLPDGNVVNSVSRTNSTSNYYLGDPRAGSTVCFTGYIGDVNIYNRALSQSEMLSNYNATKNNFVLYPNPANNVVNIKGEFDSNESITIYNMLGQVVLKKAVISNEEAIDITTLATGVYTMSFNNAKVSRKFVKN
jgi:hypothetical protein